MTGNAKWLLAAVLLLAGFIAGWTTCGWKYDAILKAEKAEMLKSIGIMDESGNLDIDKAETFVNSAFAKQQTVRVPMMGVPITFDKSDGDALIAILRKQAGE